MQESDTIFAISTPPGESLCSVIRISGPMAFSVVDKYFVPAKGNHKLDYRRGFRFYRGSLKFERDLEVSADIFVMKSPYSYTREDVVEIHTIGNKFILEAIVSKLLKDNLRLAEPGEFTRRAFLNGRIDLSRAESILELINAESIEIHKSISQDIFYTNKLGRYLYKIESDILKLLSEIEASIDFIDQDIELISLREVINRFNEIYQEITALADECELNTGIQKADFTIVLWGLPNVGKSTLFNRLSLNVKALTSEVPGTTRDFIESTFYLEGMKVALYDTAGVMEGGKFEQELNSLLENALKKSTLELINASSCIILVLDGSIEFQSQEAKLIDDLKSFKTQKIIVINKYDKILKAKQLAIKEMIKNDIFSVNISALTGYGIGKLLEVVKKMVMNSYNSSFDSTDSFQSQSHRLYVNVRQAQIIRRLHEVAKQIKDEISANNLLELVATNLRYIYSILSELTGKNYSEEVLNNIFSRFCIGK